jgi:hypothetical protein
LGIVTTAPLPGHHHHPRAVAVPCRV